jgi:hypothetical protein
MHFTAFEQRRFGHHLCVESDYFDFGLIGVDGQSRAEAKK